MSLATIDSLFFCRSIFILTSLPVTSLLTWGRIFFIAVVFRLCDLKCTGYIERDEVIVLNTLQQFFDNASCGKLIGDKNIFMCFVPHNGNLSHIQACTHKYIWDIHALKLSAPMLDIVISSDVEVFYNPLMILLYIKNMNMDSVYAYAFSHYWFSSSSWSFDNEIYILKVVEQCHDCKNYFLLCCFFQTRYFLDYLGVRVVIYLHKIFASNL